MSTGNCNINSNCTTSGSSGCQLSYMASPEICIQEGSDQQVGFRLKDKNNQLIILTGIQTIYFTSRYGHKGSVALQLECDISADDTEFYIPFTSENTTGLSRGNSAATYKYEIQFLYSDGITIPYLKGDFIVNPEVPV